jgi:hypothetical protein
MPYQVAVTIHGQVPAENVTSFREILTELNKSGPDNDTLPFSRLRGVHFARLVLLPETMDTGGQVIPASVVYMSEVDGPLDRHLDDLVQVAGPGLDRVFGRCADYPSRPDGNQARREWLRTHTLDSAAYYVNTVGRGLEQIRQEALLREALEHFVDESGPHLTGRTAVQVRSAIQKFVAGNPDLVDLLMPPAVPPVRWRVAEATHLVAVPLAGLALGPLAGAALPVWAALLRWHESHDRPSTQRPAPEHLRLIAEGEDFATQNPFTGVGLLKPGRFRRWTASTVLSLVDYGVRHVFNRGNLAGVHTIHFARWAFLDDDRRVLFASNYDGSRESYMDDFIDLVAWGLNAVFSNGVGYPRTSWLVLGGAKDEQVFKNWENSRLVPTAVWYSAYETLSTQNISDNAELRKGLVGEMTESQAAKWLALL